MLSYSFGDTKSDTAEKLARECGFKVLDKRGLQSTSSACPAQNGDNEIYEQSVDANKTEHRGGRVRGVLTWSMSATGTFHCSS